MVSAVKQSVFTTLKLSFMIIILSTGYLYISRNNRFGLEKLLYYPTYFTLSHLADLLIINKAGPVIKQSNNMTTKKILHQRDLPHLHWGLYSYTLYIVIKKYCYLVSRTRAG